MKPRLTNPSITLVPTQRCAEPVGEYAHHQNEHEHPDRLDRVHHTHNQSGCQAVDCSAKSVGVRANLMVSPHVAALRPRNVSRGSRLSRREASGRLRRPRGQLGRAQRE